jgi:hypothetical protein
MAIGTIAIAITVKGIAGFATPERAKPSPGDVEAPPR